MNDTLPRKARKNRSATTFSARRAFAGSGYVTPGTSLAS